MADDPRPGTRDRISQLGKAPPVPRRVLGVDLPEPPLEPTRPEVPLARRAQRQPTLTGSPAPPPPSGETTLQSAPEAEVTPVSGHEQPRLQRRPVAPVASDRRTLEGIGPRSLSRAPESAAGTIQVTTPDGTKVRLSTKLLRHAWMWVAPLIISALGTVYGYVRGYVKGLLDGHDEIVRMREEQRRQHDAIVKLESRADGIDAELAKEEQSSRTERATALRKLTDFAGELEQVKQGLPKIQGLPVVKAER
jgi:hypothetical protein